LINTRDLDGVFVNNKLVQTNGTLDVIHTNEARYISKNLNGTATYDGNVNIDLSSVFSNGKFLITTWAGANSALTAETDERGILRIYQFDPNLTRIFNNTGDSQYDNTIPVSYDNHGHQVGREYEDFWTTNLTHVDFVGKYLYATRIRPQNTVSISGTRSIYSTFIVAELDSDGFGIRPIGYWGAASPDPWDPTPIDDECYAKKVQVVGSTAYVLTKKQATSDWTATDSYLRALDITDPTAPTEVDKVTTVSGDNYLDFVVIGERAFISAYNDSSNSIKIIKVDVHDPSNLVAGASTTVVASGATEKPAPIKAEGQRVYLGYGNKIYVYLSNSLNVSSMATGSLISGGFTVDADLRISDIIVNGNYMYVLGENTSTGFGELYTLDITTIATPVVVGFDSRSTLTAPGKMTLVGNKIYATSSQGTGGLSTTDGGISIFELDGFVSPTASISAIKSNEVKITNNLYVGEKLDVGNSINVGSGGVYIDEGAGLAVDGPVKILGELEVLSGNINFSQFSRVSVNQSSSQTIASDLSTFYTVDFNTEDYDTLSEFNLTSNRFTATYDGYYQFEFRSLLRHATSLQEHIVMVGSTKLVDSDSNSYFLDLLWEVAAVDIGGSLALLERTSQYSISGSKTIYLSAGDWVEVQTRSYAQDNTLAVIDMGIYGSELTINRIG
jgi:hypothetical protein